MLSAVTLFFPYAPSRPVPAPNSPANLLLSKSSNGLGFETPTISLFSELLSGDLSATSEVVALTPRKHQPPSLPGHHPSPDLQPRRLCFHSQGRCLFPNPVKVAASSPTPIPDSPLQCHRTQSLTSALSTLPPFAFPALLWLYVPILC